jgi:hypothetical protein
MQNCENVRFLLESWSNNELFAEQVEMIIILDQSETKQEIKLLVGAGSIGDGMGFNLLFLSVFVYLSPIFYCIRFDKLFFFS